MRPKPPTPRVNSMGDQDMRHFGAATCSSETSTRVRLKEIRDLCSKPTANIDSSEPAKAPSKNARTHHELLDP